MKLWFVKWAIPLVRKESGMKDYVKIGIIGVGNIGSAHAASIYGGKVEGMKLTALCDTDPNRLSALRALYPDVAVFDHAEELMKSGLAEAVLIATPHYAHPPIAETAFSYGLHVLTEKPAGVYCSAVKKMMQAAEKSGKAFGVMFNQRTNTLFKKAKAIVSEGGLGELKRSVWIVTNWYRKQSYYDSGDWRATWRGEGGGVLLNQAPHNLDIFTWICGMPSSVFALCDEGKYHHIEVEDDVTIILRYPNGATGVFITSTGEYPGTNRLEMTGTKGKIVIENGVLTHTKLGIDERDYCFSDDTVKNEIFTEIFHDEKYNGHILILQNFARHILYGDALVASGYEAIRELTVSNAAYLSAWKGNEIRLPMDDALFEEILFQKVQISGAERGKNSGEDIQFSYKDRWNTNW